MRSRQLEQKTEEIFHKRLCYIIANKEDKCTVFNSSVPPFYWVVHGEPRQNSPHPQLGESKETEPQSWAQSDFLCPTVSTFLFLPCESNWNATFYKVRRVQRLMNFLPLYIPCIHVLHSLTTLPKYEVENCLTEWKTELCLHSKLYYSSESHLSSPQKWRNFALWTNRMKQVITEKGEQTYCHPFFQVVYQFLIHNNFRQLHANLPSIQKSIHQTTSWSSNIQLLNFYFKF